MKKTLYIHIGRPKVGSSAIQHFLWDNRKLLARNGYLYPETGQYHKATHGLALVFLPSLPDAKCVEGKSPKNIYKALVDEVNQTGLGKVIISSEMFYLLQEPAEIPHTILNDFDIKIVCYVRRQDEVLLSSYVQEIKGNEMKLGFDFDQYLQNETRLALLDYKSILDKWAAVFGEENIIVRVYDKAKLKGSIFEDFLAAVGAEFKDEYQLPDARLNSSPSRDVLELIYYINQFPAPDLVLRQLRAPLVRISEMIGKETRFNTNTLLSQAKRQKIMDIFAESNRQTALTYLGSEDGELFNMDFSVDDHADEYQGIELERFVQMVAGIFVNQQKEISSLRTRLMGQHDRLEKLERNLKVNDGWLSRLKTKLSF